MASVASCATHKSDKSKVGGREDRQQHVSRRLCSESSGANYLSSFGETAPQAARSSHAGSSSIISVSLHGAKKPTVGQGKGGGDRDDSTSQAAWKAQVGGPTPSSQASSIAEEYSTGSWSTVVAFPASSHGIAPHERVSPSKRASACQAVSQSPGRWAINPDIRPRNRRIRRGASRRDIASKGPLNHDKARTSWIS